MADRAQQQADLLLIMQSVQVARRKPPIFSALHGSLLHKAYRKVDKDPTATPQLSE